VSYLKNYPRVTYS